MTLTREEILAMKPGRELDKLVNHHLFGYIVRSHSAYQEGMTIDRTDFLPSTFLPNAWEVVEKLQSLRELNGRKVRLMVRVSVIRGIYTATVIDYLDAGKCLGEESSDMAPDAIVKAALLAVMDV